MSEKIDADALVEFLRDELLNGRTVSPGDDLLLTGLLDSLGVMALVSFVEGRIGATIPPQDVTLENFTSIDALMAYLSHG